MTEENIAVVDMLIDRFNAFMRGELSSAAYAEGFDPQIELVWSGQRTYPDTPQHLRGLSEIIAFAEQFREGWNDLRQEALELGEASDGRVVGLIRQSGRGRESGAPISIHFFEVCTIRDGKLRKIEYFRHRIDALEAAGLRD
jgi:ketosteroid isomerase-like protein